MDVVKVFNESIVELNLSGKDITELPDLSIYPNLRKLYCSCNEIEKLDNLPIL